MRKMSEEMMSKQDMDVTHLFNEHFFEHLLCFRHHPNSSLHSQHRVFV